MLMLMPQLINTFTLTHFTGPIISQSGLDEVIDDIYADKYHLCLHPDVLRCLFTSCLCVVLCVVSHESSNAVATRPFSAHRVVPGLHRCPLYGEKQL